MCYVWLVIELCALCTSEWVFEGMQSGAGSVVCCKWKWNVKKEPVKWLSLYLCLQILACVVQPMWLTFHENIWLTLCFRSFCRASVYLSCWSCIHCFVHYVPGPVAELRFCLKACRKLFLREFPFEPADSGNTPLLDVCHFRWQNLVGFNLSSCNVWKHWQMGRNYC